MTETSPIAIRDAGLRSSDQLVEQSGEIIRQEKIIVAKNKKIWRSDAPQETLDIFTRAENMGIDDYSDSLIPQQSPAGAQYLLGWGLTSDLDNKVRIALGEYGPQGIVDECLRAVGRNTHGHVGRHATSLWLQLSLDFSDEHRISVEGSNSLKCKEGRMGGADGHRHFRHPKFGAVQSDSRRDDRFGSWSCQNAPREVCI
jgi:hypothetical protein